MAEVKIDPATIPSPIADMIARNLAEAVKRAEGGKTNGER